MKLASHYQVHTHQLMTVCKVSGVVKSLIDKLSSSRIFFGDGCRMPQLITLPLAVHACEVIRHKP